MNRFQKIASRVKSLRHTWICAEKNIYGELFIYKVVDETEQGLTKATCHLPVLNNFIFTKVQFYVKMLVDRRLPRFIYFAQ